MAINGTVKFFNATKGFGFIQPDTGGEDTFVHISAVERAGLSGLNEGQKVSFEVEKGRDGRASAMLYVDVHAKHGDLQEGHEGVLHFAHCRHTVQGCQHGTVGTEEY